MPEIERSRARSFAERDAIDAAAANLEEASIRLAREWGPGGLESVMILRRAAQRIYNGLSRDERVEFDR
jgi:hypothetical protein